MTKQENSSHPYHLEQFKISIYRLKYLLCTFYLSLRFWESTSVRPLPDPDSINMCGLLLMCFASQTCSDQPFRWSEKQGQANFKLDWLLILSRWCRLAFLILKALGRLDWHGNTYLYRVESEWVGERELWLTAAQVRVLAPTKSSIYWGNTIPILQQF